MFLLYESLRGPVCLRIGIGQVNLTPENTSKTSTLGFETNKRELVTSGCPKTASVVDSCDRQDFACLRSFLVDTIT